MEGRVDLSNSGGRKRVINESPSHQLAFEKVEREMFDIPKRLKLDN